MNYAVIHCAKGLAILIHLKCKVQDTIYDRHYILKNLTKNVTTRKCLLSTCGRQLNSYTDSNDSFILTSFATKELKKTKNLDRRRKNYLFKYLIRFYFPRDIFEFNCRIVGYM